MESGSNKPGLWPGGGGEPLGRGEGQITDFD